MCGVKVADSHVPKCTKLQETRNSYSATIQTEENFTNVLKYYNKSCASELGTHNIKLTTMMTLNAHDTKNYWTEYAKLHHPVLQTRKICQIQTYCVDVNPPRLTN